MSHCRNLRKHRASASARLSSWRHVEIAGSISGRGSYYWLKDRIDPEREYTQLTYARIVGEVLTPQTRWLDAGGGHQIFEVATPEMELEMVRGSGWPCAATWNSITSRSIAASGLASAPLLSICRFAGIDRSDHA